VAETAVHGSDDTPWVHLAVGLPSRSIFLVNKAEAAGGGDCLREEEVLTPDRIRYERRCWLLAEALKLAPLGEALQIAKSAEAWLTSHDRPAGSEQLRIDLSNARSSYLN